MATVDEVLTELGGVARRGALLRVVDRSDLDLAVADGLVVRDAIASSVPGLAMQPQLTIRDEDGFACRPDLVDPELRIVGEADSYAFHGGRAAFAADARRYNVLVLLGWIVLRFSYEDVMFHPEAVRQALVDAVALAHRPGRGRTAA